MNILGALCAIVILFLCSYEPKEKTPYPVWNNEFIAWIGTEFVLPTFQKLGKVEHSFLEYPEQLFDILPTHIANVSHDGTFISIPYSATIKRTSLTTSEIEEKITSALRRYIARKCSIDVRDALIKGVSIKVLSIPNSMEIDVVLYIDLASYQYFLCLWNNSQTIVTY